MPDQIPPPPSGSIVYTNPAQATQPMQSQSGAIPPPPSGSIVYTQSSTSSPSLQDYANQFKSSNELAINDGDNLLTDAGKLTGQLFAGIGQGIFGTAAGVTDLADKVTGQQPGGVSQYLHNLAGDNEKDPTLLERAGRGLETLGEIFTGDEALKALSLGDRLSEASKIAKLAEKYPVAFNTIGNAARLGSVAGADTYIKTQNPEEAILSGIVGSGAGAYGGTQEADRAATEQTKAGMEPWDAANPVEVQVQKVADQLPMREGWAKTSDDEIEAAKTIAQGDFHQDIRTLAEQSLRDALGDIKPPTADQGAPAPAPTQLKPGELSDALTRAGFTQFNPSNQFVLPSEAEIAQMKAQPESNNVLQFPARPQVSQDDPAYRSAFAKEYLNSSLQHPDWTAEQVIDNATQATNNKLNIVPPAPSTGAKFNYDAPTSMRDQFGKPARIVLGAAKADFQALDAASGGRWQRFNDAIENLSDKMADANGVDDDQFNALAEKRSKIEQAQQKMVDDLKANGAVDPAIADRAQKLYQTGMAMQDINKDVQMSTERHAVPGAGVVERVNPDKLAPRLAKRNDVPLNGGPSRLEQAMGGKVEAQNLIDATDSARLNLNPEAFANMQDTGKAALRSLLRDNTASSPTMMNKEATKTDYAKALKQFEGMGANKQREIYGDDVPTVRSFLRSRARWQTIPSKLGNRLGKSLMLAAGGDYLLHSLFSGK